MRCHRAIIDAWSSSDSFFFHLHPICRFSAVNVGDVLALKSAKLGDYGGRSISTWGSTGTEVNPPDMPEAAALLSWWAAAGADASGLRSLTERGGSGGGESAGECCCRRPRVALTIGAVSCMYVDSTGDLCCEGLVHILAPTVP